MGIVSHKQLFRQYGATTSPKNGETAVYGYNSALFWVNIIIFADQVFIDPTFFGIFVCGPLWLMFVLYGFYVHFSKTMVKDIHEEWYTVK